MRAIAQFMWGFQPHFRISLEEATETAFAKIGAVVAPRAFLVGFAESEAAAFDVCIEPETGPFTQANLAGVYQEAQRRYAADPESGTFNTDPDLHRSFHARLLDHWRADALADALAATDAGAESRFFAGPAVVVGDYRVFPVLSVLANRWAALPTLRTSRRRRMRVSRSLPEATAHCLLRAAANALYRPTPPQSVLDGRRGQGAALLRDAADVLVDGITVLSGNILASGLRDSLDAVSAQPYEGRAGAGSLLIASAGHPHVHVDVRFDDGVSVQNPRAFRKVLEMSAPDLALLCDGRMIYGLGTLDDNYDATTETCFTVTILGRGTWELRHQEAPLLRMENGHPKLPRERLSKDKFADTVERLFPSDSPDSADLLWDLANACAEQAHGTMLVVHRDAAAEAQRLRPQALTITPAVLHGSTLTALTAIDGAVLVSPDGRCHAVGVILDGAATGTGDSVRGARYNSAVRYLAGAGQGSLVIIVSEDGMIDLLPNLRRRVSREQVQVAVDRLIEAATGVIDFEEFFRRDRHVESLEFYLDAAQCVVVNAAREAVENYRSEESQIRLSVRACQPHRAMNDSYFL